MHEYLTSASHANDLMYAIQAAQEHFRELSKEFIVIGHSQGTANGAVPVIIFIA